MLDCWCAQWCKHSTVLQELRRAIGLTEPAPGGSQASLFMKPCASRRGKKDHLSNTMRPGFRVTVVHVLLGRRDQVQTTLHCRGASSPEPQN